MPSIRPLSFMDEHGGGQILTLTVGLIFSGRVDASKVATAVAKLGKAWPELTGVLQLETDPRRPQLVIPDTPEEIDFTVKEFPQRLSNVYKPMKNTDPISIQPLPYSAPFSSVLGTPHIPTLREYLALGPSKWLRLQLSLFEDASIFTVLYMHAIMDASGHAEVMKALITLINDPEATIEPTIDEDPFRALLDTAPGDKMYPAPSGWHVATVTELGAYMAADTKDLEMDGKIENRRIYFPASEVERMRREFVRGCIATPTQ